MIESIRRIHCSKCREWKEINNFYLRPDGRGRRTMCNVCQNKKQLEWREDNPERYNRIARRSEARRRGIICEDIELWYSTQLEKQGGRCAMPDCRLPAEDNRHGRLFIDHDHKTGKLRGLLCNRCNSFVGHYEKRQAVIEMYLNLPSE